MTDNTLHLNLKRKWFDMILKGIKTEEYRDIKPFWDKRFWHLFPQEIKGETFYPIVDTITFSNGYSKTRSQFVIELKSLKKRTGIENWGANKDVKYYVFELGKIIKAGRQGFHFRITEEMPLNEIVNTLNM
ncbi:hypothetical protein [Tenacibaculum sp. Bg11-29]|uniref:hypothetical protein n=1 Tax=Tenacibaculum sp. Bg11-29 TaxID=2058306 RepID=UPI0018E335E9|nr:hypothetical protein [Tenacibaculum sp. Bg11-29]